MIVVHRDGRETVVKETVEVYERMVRGEATPEEYVADVNRYVKEMMAAFPAKRRWRK